MMELQNELNQAKQMGLEVEMRQTQIEKIEQNLIQVNALLS